MPFFAAPALPFAFDAAAVMLCPAMFLVDGTAHKPRVARTGPRCSHSQAGA